MATTMQSAGEIRSQVSTPETTTAQTLNMLRAILGLQLEQTNAPAVLETGRKAPPRRPPPKTKPTAKPTQRKDASTKFTIHEPKVVAPAPLNVKERKRFATETFNATLKALSAAVRKRQQEKAATPAKARPKATRDGGALQNCSSNGKAQKMPKVKASEGDIDLQPTAQCASAALECLRQLHEQGSGADPVDMGLENGGLVLLDKLISLELGDEAAAQSRRLHEQYWKKRRDSKEDQDCSNVFARLKVGSEDNMAAHKFATSLQGQLIRLAILQSPNCLQGTFAEHLQLDTEGTPAPMIMRGHELGFLDAETTGTQLRTLSLALSKLQANMPARASTAIHEQSIQLAAIALQIKCMSWKLLGHQPELERELWTPFAKATQKAAKALNDAQRLQNIMENCVGAIRNRLQEQGLSQRVPAALRKYCSAAEQTPRKSEDMSRLERTMTKLNLEDRALLPSSLQICLARIEQWKADPKQAVIAVQHCIEALQSAAEPRVTTDEELIAMAHLRKAAVSAADEIIVLQKSNGSTDCYNELHVCLIRVVYAFLAYCHSSYKSDAHRDTASAPTSKSKSNTILSYAKTMEAVFHFEQQVVTRSVLLEDETHQTIVACLDFVSLLLPHLESCPSSEAVVKFIRGVPLRISHAYWSRYLFYTESKRPVAVRIDALQRSVSSIEQSSSNERSSAMLSLKYEKLSSLWVESKSFSKAQASLASAIQASIDQGMLKEVTTTCLTQTAGFQSSDNKSPVHRFAQTLARYVDLSLRHNVPNAKGTWYHDSHGLQGIERAMLLEIQLLAALEACAIQLKPEQVKSLLSLWEQLSFEPKYRVYQLRTVSQLLQVLGKHKHLDAGNILGSLIVRQESLPQALPKDTALLECLAVIRPLESIQWAFAANSMCESLLTKQWDDLRQVLEELVKDDTLNTVPSLSILLSTISAVAEYAGVLGIARIQLEAAELSTKVFELQASKQEKKLPWLLAIAVAGVDLDRTIAAGKALAAAENLSIEGALDYVRWALGSAEYHSSLGNVQKSTELLLGCRDQFDAITTSSPRERLDKEVQLSRAVLLASRLALHQGNMAQAIQYARQAVKLSSGIWASLEKTLQVSDSPQLRANDTDLSGLTHDFSSLSIDSQSSKPLINHHGARYWSAVSIHRRILRHTADLSAHNGVYQDALFFAQQAAKITAWTGCEALRYCVTSELAQLYAGAQEQKASLRLFPSTDTALDLEAAVNYAEAALQLGDLEKAQALFLLARSAQKTPAAVAVRETTKIQAPAKPVRTAKKTTAKKGRKTAFTQAPSPSAETLPKPTWTMQIKRLHARLQTLDDELRVAGIERDDTTSIADFSRLSPNEILSRGSVLVYEAIKQFAADPAHNAIAETALAIPVKYRSVRKSGQMSLLLESPVKLNRQLATELAETGDGLLQQAYDWLRTIDGDNLTALASDKVTLLHQLLSRVVLLSTALKSPLSYSPLSTVLQSLRPKDASRYRERCVILAEQQTAERQQIQQWPSLAEGQDCQQDYSDLMKVLPSSWTILSLGLSSDGKELLLSKILKGRTPFLMRVPLERPGVDDDEPCEFTLDFAKEELRDIVQKANDTAHDRRGQGDKAERKAWYAERELLDKRTELLLANIENIWLGGFRGLLSPTSPDEGLLSRFGESLTQSLGKHLPSRQKKAKLKNKVDLHAHVLELFTSVAFEEADADFEDSITDLLYFVVDILQFNGEANAFDEIDFDAMLVDTIDALRGYHAAADKAPAQHSILVIDKELQAFPWESLPCLRGRPASRMPSLSAIKERLDLMHSETYTIPRSGSYILNPSNDLPNTQATFEPLLSPLSFESLTAQTPTEAAFAHLLSSSSIMLYFGHGAGLQYIRGRTIRKLPQCAVTWLMGCSSAKLTECGIFESYGVPWHYMHAGAPAVVGTLWDVTDRDIDRFAVKALGDWGLIDVEGLEEGFWGRKGRGNGKVKGKGKERAMDEKKRTPVPLDEAVAGARDACQLRYLNGAAVVVYGVPVSLE